MGDRCRLPPKRRRNALFLYTPRGFEYHLFPIIDYFNKRKEKREKGGKRKEKKKGRERKRGEATPRALVCHRFSLRKGEKRGGGRERRKKKKKGGKKNEKKKARTPSPVRNTPLTSKYVGGQLEGGKGGKKIESAASLSKTP